MSLMLDVQYKRRKRRDYLRMGACLGCWHRYILGV